MVLIIDNYDSFVYNLAQYIGELGWEPVVHRNDKISVRTIEELQPSHIVISPGPCTPREAGISNDAIRHLAGKTPILGVCLGHQCIGYVYGGEVVHAPIPTHGKSSPVFHDGRTIYRNLSNPFQAGRYHSLVVQWNRVPDEIELPASTEDGIIMGIRHKQYVVEGVQFHPESIMTDVGRSILRNFLAYDKPTWE